MRGEKCGDKSIGRRPVVFTIIENPCGTSRLSPWLPKMGGSFPPLGGDQI